MRGGRAAELVVILILAFGTWLGFATAGLPAVVPASAPPTAFSAERALPDLRAITATPHTVGSIEHDRLRDYLVDRLRSLGFDEVHVQSATGFNTLQGPLAATVANVVARKRGTGSGPAILLSSHYDAVPRSFGAGDDGAAVAAMLETVRALASEPPLARDLIVAFNDAEENGLLGAEAFVNLHPWAKDVGVVLNFDGRGTAGPVYMFQTSRGNAPFITALAQVSGARTNSLTDEVYRHLPSDTDLSIWLHSKFAVGALNFAHVGRYQEYHTPSDNIASLDPRIVQQMGDYALSLTRTLGATDLQHLQASDAIYFNAPILGVVRYPGSWSLILALDGAVLAIVLIVFGFYRRILTLAGVLRGTLALLVSLLLPALATFAMWRLVALMHPGYQEILQGDPYNSLWYLLASAAFTVAVAVTIHSRMSGRSSALELAVAPLVLWSALGLAIAQYLPGASYLTAWPLFAMTMSVSWWRRSQARGVKPSPLLALLAIPALILWAPLVMSLEVALTAKMLPYCALLVALMLSAIVLPLQLAGESRRWIVRAAAVVCVAALVRAETLAGFSVERKQPNSLAYLVDSDSTKGWWVSFDRATDPWTTLALGSNPARRRFDDFGPIGNSGDLLSSDPTTATPIASPVQVLSNEPVDAGRRVHLHIVRSAPGEAVALYVDTTVRISQVVINERVLADGTSDRYQPLYHRGRDGELLRYFGVPAEGIDLWFTAVTTGTATLRVLSSVPGMPDLASGPLPVRAPTMMSKPFVNTDATTRLWRIPL